jgi:hypothetical protein
MEPTNQDKVPLCKIPYFAGGMELLVEWKRWGCTIDQKIVAAQLNPI